MTWGTLDLVQNQPAHLRLDVVVEAVVAVATPAPPEAAGSAVAVVAVAAVGVAAVAVLAVAVLLAALTAPAWVAAAVPALPVPAVSVSVPSFPAVAGLAAVHVALPAAVVLPHLASLVSEGPLHYKTVSCQSNTLYE